MKVIPVICHKTVTLTWLILLLTISSCAVQQAPLLIPFDDGENWVLGNNLVYKLRGTDQEIVVPRGFVTDFASVPRVFWTLFPRHGRYTRASILHDFLYWDQSCTREQADELFDAVMTDSAVDSASRLTIYATVRMWGDSAWQENATAKAQGYTRVIPEPYINFPADTRWETYQVFLHEMSEEEEYAEVFPMTVAPAYCTAWQKKTSPVEAEVQAATDITDDAAAP